MKLPTYISVAAAALTVDSVYGAEDTTKFGKYVSSIFKSEDTSCKCENGKAKVWGPGGPHTALIPVAKLFSLTIKYNQKQRLKSAMDQSLHGAQKH